MIKKEESILDRPPNLRPKYAEETTPEYLNYISNTIDQFHEKLLMEKSPFFKILNIFQANKPLGLDDIQEIINEVKSLDKK
jgi:hypothetical protein